MKFYQYWIGIIIAILVIISIINIAKMIMIVSKNKGNNIEPSDELNIDIRNLLISIGLLSVITLIYIILIFKQI